MGTSEGPAGHLYTELSLSPQLLSTLDQQSVDLQSVTASESFEPGPAILTTQGDAVSFNGLGQASTKWPCLSPRSGTVALFKRPEALTPLVLPPETHHRSSIDIVSTNPSQPLVLLACATSLVSTLTTSKPDSGTNLNVGLPRRRVTHATPVIRTNASKLAVDDNMDAQSSTSSSPSDTEPSVTSGVLLNTKTVVAWAQYYGRSLVDRLTHIRLTAEVRRILILAWLLAGMGVALYIIIMGAFSLDSSRSAHLRSKCSYQAQLLTDSFMANVKEVRGRNPTLGCCRSG